MYFFFFFYFRRIDISPSTFRKHGFSQEESKSSRDPGFKVNCYSD